MLALLSALLYAVYMTLLKVRIGSESRINMQFFFGCVGLINIFLSFPVGALLHFIDVERFEFPGSKREIAFILINVREVTLPHSSTMSHFLSRWLSPYQVTSSML